MKILLDESLPRKLKYDFGREHTVSTLRDKKWLGKKNGELLKLMIKDGIEVFITVDRNLKFQQNLNDLSLTIIVFCARNNTREVLKPLIPKLLDKLNAGNLSTVIEIF